MRGAVALTCFCTFSFLLERGQNLIDGKEATRRAQTHFISFRVSLCGHGERRKEWRKKREGEMGEWRAPPR